MIGDFAGRVGYDAIFGQQDPKEQKNLDEYGLMKEPSSIKVYILKEQVITN